MMTIEEARRIILENRPERPRSLDKKKLQQAIDTIIESDEEVIDEALNEIRTER